VESQFQAELSDDLQSFEREIGRENCARINGNSYSSDKVNLTFLKFKKSWKVTKVSKRNLKRTKDI
jgi:hypothetical protein